jgi:phosphoribosylanthranilate isomerase
MNKKIENITQSTLFTFERAGVRLKVCGMKYQDNIEQVAALQPDYLGFIFYEKSARHFDSEIPKLAKSIKKVGVFVDQDIETVTSLVKIHQLQAVQLHGAESPEYCLKLKSFISSAVEIIKVFSIKNEFNFDVLKPYENVCDYFLFDTKGKLPGGNGYAFDWNVLKNYASTKPFFLSGGIGIEQIEDLKKFQLSEASKYCYAIDVNSRFEMEPGLKNIELLKEFKENVITKRETTK